MGKKVQLKSQCKRIFVCVMIAVVIFTVISGLEYTLKKSSIYADENLNDVDSLILYVNLERINSQLVASKNSLENGHYPSAFEHTFLPHAFIFPTIKDFSKEVDPPLSLNLESVLTDIPLNIQKIQNSNNGQNVTTIHNDVINSLQKGQDIISAIKDKVNSFIGNNSKSFYSQSSIILLDDSLEAYKKAFSNSSNSDPNSFNYENAIAFLNASKTNFEKVSDSVDKRRSDEISSFYNELLTSIQNKQDKSVIDALVSAIKRDYNEELSLVINNPTSNQYSTYFNKITSLLNSVKENVSAGNYAQADKAAIEAYLDNFEYLEAPLEKLAPNLMVSIEVDMREKLREQIQAENSIANITDFVNSLSNDIKKAENLIRKDPTMSLVTTNSNLTKSVTNNLTGIADISGLSQGFGTFKGEQKSIGEAADESKEEVRNDIDTIRSKLSDMLSLYSVNNTEGALFASRAAYLDSYEKIEIPLRPIDPDFTLEMEIKFAELRNLIQTKAPYPDVLSKTTEIRNGLDESERLVSGTGVLAPTIAFSSSFSIIFREGLESALIIGAIITYLEASRNEKYKKHVYAGIALAIGATGVTWVIAEFIIEISGVNKELIEAIAGISAVAVLFWVSFWVLNKIETKKWIEFVKAKVWQAATTGSVMVFVMLSFFTVYREGFETVLFYQAMLSFAKYMEWYVVAGMVIGIVVIVSIAIVVNKLGKRLPLKVLFAFTMGVGAYMSIAFIGNAIREFQEVGYISTTPMLGTIPRLHIDVATMTGIHPTLETVVAQLVLLTVYIIGSLYVLVLHPKKKKMIEKARKSMADKHDNHRND